MKKVVGWWFTFSPESDQILTGIIQNLATEFGDGKIFVPHLSFYSYTELEEGNPEVLSKEIIYLIKPFTVQTKGLNFLVPVHKTLFVETEIVPDMSIVRDFIESNFHQNYELHPHISLSYNSRIPMTTREKLCKEIKIPSEITIDSISYYIPPQGKESAEYFASWPKPTRINLS
jgi:hypothetical protein